MSMIKHFHPRRALARPEWPGDPSQVPSVFSGRQSLRKLRVLVDADLIAAPAAKETLDKSTLLIALLGSGVIEFYRYTDGLPPAAVAPVDLSPHPVTYPVYAGWAVAYPPADEYDHWAVTYCADPNDGYSLGGVVGNMIELARSDESQAVYAELDPEQRAQRREFDALALQVASQAVDADMFITQRPYLYSASPFVSKTDVTVCTVEEAIPLIALYLRAQREFILPTGDPSFKFRFNRGLYYWVGARELLPEAWRWFSACVQHATGSGDDKLMLLGGSVLSRVTRALQERDGVHIALNQPANNDTADEALGCLDSVLVLLMGAVDASARVAHAVLNLSGGEYNAAWQRERWREQVAAAAPDLAAVVAPGTAGAQTLTILRLLRNSVHGAALQGIRYLLDGKAETRIGLPASDEAELLAAMDALGGRASWGVSSLGAGLNHVEPAVLVERLFEAVMRLLNILMKETPVETLPHVTITADSAQPPIEDPAKGRLNTFSAWNRSAIRWQLGF